MGCETWTLFWKKEQKERSVCIALKYGYREEWRR